MIYIQLPTQEQYFVKTKRLWYLDWFVVPVYMPAVHYSGVLKIPLSPNVIQLPYFISEDSLRKIK